MHHIPFDRSFLQLSNGIRHVMPPTDRKLELTAKSSMAQPVSQPAVWSNGLVILPLMRIFQLNLMRTTDTHYRHTLQTHTTDTHYRHTLQTRTTDTHYRHTLQTHTTDTHYRHTLQTHTTDTHYRHIPFHFSHKERTPAISSLVLELLKKCRVR